jgi:hypothetical protein
MDEQSVRDFVDGLSKRVGIDAATAEKVVSYLKEQAARVPALLSSLSSIPAGELASGMVKGLADKLPTQEQAAELVKGLADKLPVSLGSLLGGSDASKPKDAP